MSRTIRGAGGGLYTLGVLAALAFGATQVLAQKPPSCAGNPAFTCFTSGECATICPGGSGGVCNTATHCCDCF